MALAPPTVCVVGTNGKKAAEGVAVGTLFQVRPGERIPPDRMVAHGNSDVNQVSITGESMPDQNGRQPSIRASFDTTANATG